MCSVCQVRVKGRRKEEGGRRTYLSVCQVRVKGKEEGGRRKEDLPSFGHRTGAGIGSSCGVLGGKTKRGAKQKCEE